MNIITKPMELQGGEVGLEKHTKQKTKQKKKKKKNVPTKMVT